MMWTAIIASGQQDYTSTTSTTSTTKVQVWSLTKLGRETGHGPGENPLNFGADPDHLPGI